MKNLRFAAPPLLALLVSSVVFVACSEDDKRAGVPSPGGDTGLPVFETAPRDTGQPLDTSPEEIDTGGPGDTMAPEDVEHPDVMGIDTELGDVIKLEEGGPPDAMADTSVPDILFFMDTEIPETDRD